MSAEMTALALDRLPALPCAGFRPPVSPLATTRTNR